MTPWAYAAVGAAALGLGFVGSLVGLGGGIFLVAILTLGFGYEIHQAIGSTALALVPGAFIASIGYLRRGLADIPLALLITLPTIGAAFLGASLTAYLSPSALQPFFAALLVVLALRMAQSARAGSETPGRLSALIVAMNGVRPIYRRVAVDVTGKTFRYQASLLLIVLLGAAAGLLGGLFGVGGGFLTTPVMVLAFRAPIRVAAATSLLLIGVTAATGSISHYYYGHVEPWLAIVMGIGLSLGGLMGPRAAAAASEKLLKLTVAGLLGAVALAMGISTAVIFF